MCNVDPEDQGLQDLYDIGQQQDVKEEFQLEPSIDSVADPSLQPEQRFFAVNTLM